MKRAIILLGAGASIEYKAPSTAGQTDAIEGQVMADPWMRKTKGDQAFAAIKNGLKNYLAKPGIVHFEHIYHCAHELLATFDPTIGAYDEFRPILHPFIQNISGIEQTALKALVEQMAKIVAARSDREEFARTVRSLCDYWISNEFHALLPDIARRTDTEGPRKRFLLSTNREPVAWTDPHGGSLQWLGDQSVASSR